jgi:hypothetical protein
MKIAFHTNEINVRGTELATYRYAHYNETLLGNESIYIAGPPTSRFEHPLATKKFEERFKVFRYNNWGEVQNILDQENVDVLYMQKGGEPDGKLSKKTKTCVHAVFQNDEPHGDVYAYISEWLSLKMTGGSQPFVPYIVEFKTIEGDLREELGIPKDAIVLGRTGGPDQFDIPFVHQAIEDVLKEREDIFFLFLYTDKFYEHERIKYFDATADEDFKSLFMNTCDAMIHARLMGESFGLAIAEFSLMNKPVITGFGGRDQAHIHMLKKQAIYYNDYDTIKTILKNIKKTDIESLDWNAYRGFSPEIVMDQFEKVFLK